MASAVLSSDRWHEVFEVPAPETFSASVQSGIKKGVISSKARREIVQVLRTFVTAHTVYPTSEEYVAVVTYPNLRDPIGTNGFVRNNYDNNN